MWAIVHARTELEVGCRTGKDKCYRHFWMQEESDMEGCLGGGAERGGGRDGCGGVSIGGWNLICGRVCRQLLFSISGGC